MGRIVIATYKPKPEKMGEFLEFLKGHLPILRRLGLATDREPILMFSENGSIIEVFEWKSREAVEQAHRTPEVHAMWQRFEELCECVPYGSLPEATELFPNYDSIDL